MENYAQNFSKYRRWYLLLVERGRGRDIPSCYTEVHHIHPRSLGGSDDPDNLVRLTYREHFLAHWLLTKFMHGRDLRNMQRALWAMALKAGGGRTVGSWQFDAARRATRDLELDPDAERLWYDRWAASRAHIGPPVKRSRKNKRPGKRARTRDMLRVQRQVSSPPGV
jgi:hypothetical protein